MGEANRATLRTKEHVKTDCRRFIAIAYPGSYAKNDICLFEITVYGFFIQRDQAFSQFSKNVFCFVMLLI